MAGRTIIPFGPQHPVLPEPIHLDLVIEDEKVIEAVPSLGFIHRGLELLVEKKDFHQMVYIAERICGICSMIHGMGICCGIERIMKIDIPERAEFLRVIWSEMSRIHSHLLWLGLAADAAGYESLFMHSWRIREKILEIIEKTTGGRVIFGVCKVGGTRRDIENNEIPGILSALKAIEEDYRDIAKVFRDDYTIKNRFSGVGFLSKKDAYELGAVGPTLRGSGVSSDMRQTGYSAYRHLDFEPVTETSEDCYGRCLVRVREIFQSFNLIYKAAEKMSGGPVDIKVTGNPDGEYFTRLEQPRGEVVYYIKGNGTQNLERFRARTPTFANIAPLVRMLAGCELADVPVIVLSIDPCISCTER